MTHQEDERHEADRTAIRAVLMHIADAWNRADGTAFGACFTADADYIDVTGTHTVGSFAIGALHQLLFDGPLKGSRLEWQSEPPKISFLASEVALVISGGASLLAGQEASPDRQSINTTVLIKQHGTWLVRSFQNNRVVPPNSFGRPTAPVA